MTTFLSFAIGFAIGFLTVSNNKAKADAIKEKGKALLEALKGKK